MRGLLVAVILAGLAWGGYWVVGSRLLQGQIDSWFQAEAMLGVDVTRQAVEVQGFPSRFDVTVSEPHVSDPSGWAWDAPFLQVFSMTWKPWHLIAALPETQTLTLPGGQQLAIGSKRMRASLLLHPGLDLALDQAVVESGALTVTGAGQSWGMERLVLAAGEDPTWANGLRLGLQGSRLTVDPAAAQAVPDLGPVMADLHLDATLQLTAPIDRHVQGPIGITDIHLNESHVTWGALRLAAKGALKRDAQGRAEGQIAVTLDHWQRLPDALIALGLMPEGSRALVTRALTLLAQSAGGGDSVQVPLVMKDGRMALGALPLGSAPRLP